MWRFEFPCEFVELQPELARIEALVADVARFVEGGA
jgi:hypothetical protein